MKFTLVTSPLQRSNGVGWITSALGFTVIVNVFEGPVQIIPLLVYVGVTTMFAICGVVPVFTAVNATISTVPEVFKLMLGL
jgi:hypothetical protein